MCKDLLVSFGGHEGAAGFSIDEKSIPGFIEAFEQACEHGFQGVSMEQSVYLDGMLRIDEATGDFLNSCLRLEPFGRGNPVPVFGFRIARLLGQGFWAKA